MGSAARANEQFTSQWFSSVAGLYALLGGALTFYGWYAGIPRLTDWSGSGITMKANPAILAMAAGLGLLLLNFSRIKTLRIIVIILGSFTVLIGLLTAIQHFSALDFGIDTFLFDEPPNQRATAAPGRMGIPASVSFVLIGIAFLCSVFPRARRYASLLGVMIAAGSLLSILGYLYGAPTAYTLPRVTGIAFQTAMIVLVVGLGIVASIPERDPVRTISSDTAAGMMIRRVLPLIVLIPIFIGWLRIQGETMGLFDSRFGAAARSLVEVILMSVLLWWSASAVKKYEETLRENHRRKDEFLAMLSHELRNPIAAIRRNLEVIRAGNINKTDIRQIDIIDRQSGQLARLVDDLLDTSRFTTGKVEILLQPTDLRSIVTDAAQAARPAFETAGIQLAVDLPNEPVYVSGDPIRLNQVVGNLLSNAAKFTNSGGRVALSLDERDGQARISVKDTGIGISAEERQRIFDMFVQADTSLERTTSGLGIGLTLVKELVELHGGSVDVQSDGIGSGSEFIVILPLTTKRPEPQPLRAVPEIEQPPTARKILVVDDNVDSAEALAMLLEIGGDDVKMAHDGLEAVEAAAEFRPGVVILDIGLPRLNGYEVAETIRREPWGNEPIIIALTGWGQDDDRKRSKDSGFDGHLVKPVDHTKLLQTIDELTNSRSQAVTG